jgi:hypothetical protein
MKILKKEPLPLFQFILSSRFLCLAEALNGLRKKNIPIEQMVKSPKKIVLKSTICFLT